MIRCLTAEDHDQALAHGMAVLVFQADECPAGNQFRPELDEFARRNPDCAIWTVDPTAQSELAELHHLYAVPSIVIYRDGLPLRRFAGTMSADELAKTFNELTAADMQHEINGWVLEMIESGEHGSPAIAV